MSDETKEANKRAKRTRYAALSAEEREAQRTKERARYAAMSEEEREAKRAKQRARYKVRRAAASEEKKEAKRAKHTAPTEARRPPYDRDSFRQGVTIPNTNIHAPVNLPSPSNDGSVHESADALPLSSKDDMDAAVPIFLRNFSLCQDENAALLLPFQDEVEGEFSTSLDSITNDQDDNPLKDETKSVRSFYRQLYLWGFASDRARSERSSGGRDAGAWHHPHFLHGAPGEMRHMTKSYQRPDRGRSETREAAPDIYRMPSLPAAGGGHLAFPDRRGAFRDFDFVDRATPLFSQADQELRGSAALLRSVNVGPPGAPKPPNDPDSFRRGVPNPDVHAPAEVPSPSAAGRVCVSESAEAFRLPFKDGMDDATSLHLRNLARAACVQLSQQGTLNRILGLPIRPSETRSCSHVQTLPEWDSAGK